MNDQARLRPIYVWNRMRLPEIALLLQECIRKRLFEHKSILRVQFNVPHLIWLIGQYGELAHLRPFFSFEVERGDVV